MHGIIIASGQNVHLVGVFTVLACSIRRHLEVEPIENALCVIGSLKLDIGVEVVLNA